MHMNTYCLSIFVLSKRALKVITGILRNYIWSGQVYTTKPLLVAWDIVCMSKKEEGLGVIDCMVWTEAAIAKYVWNIANKADNLWVKLVNHVYLKGEG
ncbi:hypothetical protein R3W88_023876 [Solanum pinnatisectum]|uniref:Uncharacterized protein n=1 Tax=Solanum pinnatisectum TaxID=50273 RepID=A0AAV9LZL7_9SOLN|nr:hypothetical protein R3W88_023876 [Solanum pinnatisectum]